MFKFAFFFRERDSADVGRALVQKLSPIRPLHVHVEGGSKDGVVFARFATLPDCKAAFTALHGTWFNGTVCALHFCFYQRTAFTVKHLCF